jgi:hypothetical protein
MKRQVHTGSHRVDIEFPGWWLDISYSILRHDGDDEYEFDARINETVLHTPAGLTPMPAEALGEMYSRIEQEIADEYSSEIDQRGIEHLEEA